MSLVVGEVHDGGVSLVADTKVTHRHEDSRTRQVFENALPKLVLLREDLCVGIAGNDPVGTLTTLVDNRARSLQDLTELAVATPHASFVIAALGPSPQLWQVRAGRAENRSSVGRAWVGDHDAYEIFQEQYAQWPDGVDPAFRLLSSLQWLLTWNQVPSVGGYHTRVATTPQGFRFMADATNVGPEELHGFAAIDDGKLTLHLRPTADGDQSFLPLLCAVGRPPTFGALAYYVAPAGLALLFSHSAPMEPIAFRARSLAELIEVAAVGYGQNLGC